jgi:23S rRNA pseudoU1915 N3-methylase RlmH
MGSGQSIKKVNFEDVQRVVKNHESYLLINTFPTNEQNCLITNSILASQEEQIINSHLERGSKLVNIIVYGKNTNDDTAYIKYQQLRKLGFSNVYLYLGGMFEWLLLQDVFGSEEFMTTSKHLDILKYRPQPTLHVVRF